MFELISATVYYGTSAYPLNSLEDRGFAQIEGIDDPRLRDLTRVVGELTGFPREFKIKHMERFAPENIRMKDGTPLVMPEQIVASANGYLIAWHKKGEVQ